MGTQSPYLLTKKLEGELSTLLSSSDAYAASGKLGSSLTSLRRQIIDTRIAIRDYELSETREEQIQKRDGCRKRLQTLRDDLLEVSQNNIFTAIDIAYLSAQIDSVLEALE